MKRALITGADGFIGSHLTELLLKKGFKVKALSQYNSFNNWGWLENSLNNFLRKTLDSPPPRASGEGGILYTEFREEVCVSHLGGAEN